MSDDLLLANLRTIGTHHCDNSVGMEAAEEIERLRCEVKDLRAENERWHNAAITAEKWRGIALASGGDGRTLAEMEREKHDAVEAERQRARLPDNLVSAIRASCKRSPQSLVPEAVAGLLRAILAAVEQGGRSDE